MPQRRQERGEDGLTDFERRFVAEYLIDLEQAAAMKRTDGGTREKNWRQLGYQMMKRVHVKAAVDAALARRAEALDLNAQKVLRDIERLALKAEAAGEFTAAMRGRQLQGMHLKLFTEKHEHGGVGGGPVQFVISEKEADL